MALGEALGGLVGGILGSNAAKMDRSHAKQAMRDAMKVYEQLGFPPDLSKELIVEELQRQGIYTPELEQDLSDSFAESELGKISEDPTLRNAQLKALASMQQRAKVGLSAEDRAALNQVRQEVQRDAEAKRQQIMQNMAARGQGGSGAELAAQLQAGQAAADQAAAGSDTLMAQAQQRALQALGQSADLAGGIRGQDFGVNQARAQAIDERNRFLAENSIARQQSNINRLNQAQQLNLSEQQRLHEANIANRRAEAERQVAEQGRKYDRGLSYAAGKSGQSKALSDFYSQQASDKAAAQVAMGKGVGGIVDSGVAAGFGSPAAGTGSSGYGDLLKKFTT
jgi:hypothetical protein